MDSKTLKNKIIERIDINRLHQLKSEFTKQTDNRGLLKYFNYDFEIENKLRFAQDINLHITTKKKILDISCGMAYFGFICKFFGHDVTVTDIDQIEYDITRKELFGFDKILFSYPINPCKFAPLPSNIGKEFDVISALSVGPMSFWIQPDWKLFIDDCMTHMNSNGTLYIRPNSSEGLRELITIAPTNKYYHRHNNRYVVFIKGQL
jgi:2-polyprenyl-3-methyl-5-hydroxy-6-metoxy-1,4-benzoquinol methylase